MQGQFQGAERAWQLASHMERLRKRQDDLEGQLLADTLIDLQVAQVQNPPPFGPRD
jgi:hypothetical protein